MFLQFYLILIVTELNKINMSELPSYEIVKYSDEQIIMKNLATKELYIYLNHAIQPFQQICHPNIQTPIVFENGLLFPLPLTTLAKQIDLIHKNQQSSFEQNELANTFIPIIQVLKEIHQKGVIHGALSTEGIIFNNQGDIKVLYPSPKQFSFRYYGQGNKTKKSEDYEVVGKIMLQFITQAREENIKKGQNSYRSKLQKISKTNRYSASFLCALLIMLEKIQNHFSQLTYLLQNQDYIRLEKNTELRKLYQSLLRENENKHKTEPQYKHKRVIIKEEFTPPLIKHSEQINSPKNKNQVIVSKKLVRAEQNAQNKKTFEQIKRKEQKGIDTVLKNMRNAKLVVEGENYDNLYKKILRDIRQTKERQDIVKITTKRRTISKKKLNS